MGVGRSTVSVHVFAVDCQRACVGRGVAVSAIPVSVGVHGPVWCLCSWICRVYLNAHFCRLGLWCVCQCPRNVCRVAPLADYTNSPIQGKAAEQKLSARERAAEMSCTSR